MLSSIPFSYHWILKKAIGADTKTLLDMGCGEGDLMQDVSVGSGWSIWGVELFDESIRRAKKTGVYEKIVKGDVVRLPQILHNKTFDVVFCSQVIEHLTKKDGLKAMKEWENLAKKRIVISTPVGFIKYHRFEDRDEDNPLQTHLSGWSVDEFKKKGYTVYGQGARFIYGEQGLARKYPQLLLIWRILGYICSPIVYWYPQAATYMISWKDK
jgi:ubiquinone/menaquinone biosynthesis C-methylase UbiE